MKRECTVLKVKILLDPVPGFNHTPESMETWLHTHLNHMFSWYEPTVELLGVEEVPDD